VIFHGALSGADHVCRRIFSDTRNSARDRHLAIVVRDRFIDVEQALAVRWNWHKQLFEVCPVPLANNFRLGMEYAE
jgi:hypothetical protein